MSHNGIVRYYIPSLRFKVVYVLVRWPFIVESMQGQCLEFGGVGSCVPFCWVGSDYPHILETVSVCENLEALLQFAHPLRITALVLWVIFFFGWGFMWLRVGMLFILGICRRWALSSFCLPLDFLEGVLAFIFFLSLNSYDIICLRVSINSYWARIISNCSCWTRASSSNRLACSSRVPAI